MKLILVFLSCLVYVCKCTTVRSVSFRTCKNKYLDSSAVTNLQVRSEIGCARACVTESTCTAANYDKNTKTCELLRENIADTCDKFNDSDATTLLIKSILTSTDQATRTTEAINPCKYNQSFDGTTCLCNPPLTGKYCENGPRDCSDYPSEYKQWVEVYPEDEKGSINVFCYETYLYVFAAPANGFTPEFLNKSWNEYKSGFGDIKLVSDCGADGGYWLGNDKIHRITNSSRSYQLDYAGTFPSLKYGSYENWTVDDEANNYTIHYSRFQSWYNFDETLQNNRPFRSFDRNDDGCAASRQVGFWFDSNCSGGSPPLFGYIMIGGQKKSYTDFWGCLKQI